MEELDQRQHYKAARYIVRKLVRVKGYENLLKHIFSLYLNSQTEPNALKNLNNHLEKIFDINPNAFLEVFNAKVNYEELAIEFEFEDEDWIDAYKVLYWLMQTYGPYYSTLSQSERNPFLLTGTNVNIGFNESTHSIRFFRADGQFMDFSFKPDTLMPTAMTIIQSLEQAIKNGIFNLNQQTVEEYIQALDSNSSLLKDMLAANRVK